MCFGVLLRNCNRLSNWAIHVHAEEFIVTAVLQGANSCFMSTFLTQLILPAQSSICCLSYFDVGYINYRALENSVFFIWSSIVVTHSISREHRLLC